MRCPEGDLQIRGTNDISPGSVPRYHSVEAKGAKKWDSGETQSRKFSILGGHTEQPTNR